MVAHAYLPTLADVSEGLEALSAAMRDYREFNARQKAILSTLVAELRAAGATWQEIGRAAGISHQAAMKRWRDAPFPVPPPEEWVDPDEDLVDDEGWGSL